MSEENKLQRTDEWHEQRKGRFTASEVHKLMGKQGLGETGISYARKKAQEVVFGIDPEWNVSDYNMRRGIEQEPIAFELFKNKMELDFIEVQECSFFPIGANAGSSPDGLVGSDAILEIKCPSNDLFFLLVEKGHKAIKKDYLYQMQMQMKATNSNRCHFFNYLYFNGEHLTHELIVERDEETIDLIMKRIELAVIERDEIIKTLIENCQFKHLLKPN